MVRAALDEVGGEHGVSGVDRGQGGKAGGQDRPRFVSGGADCSFVIRQDGAGHHGDQNLEHAPDASLLAARTW